MIQQRNILLLILSVSIFLIATVHAYHSIIDYGAVATEVECDTAQAFKNTEAFMKAVQAVNASKTDRVVYVPEIANKSFYMMPVLIENMIKFTIQIDGRLVASSDKVAWPNHTQEQMAKNEVYAFRKRESHHLGYVEYADALSFLEFHDCRYMDIKGSGSVDGQGYGWWIRQLLHQNNAGRPHLLRMDRVQSCKITGVKWLNSPMYHILLTDVNQFEITDFEIYVDIYQQKSLQQLFGVWNYTTGLPSIPMNTDGIDPSGTNIHIRNITITNYDDAVSVKEANTDYRIANCAQNILIEDCKVLYGMGMAMGSVDPHENHNCIKDVVIRNVTFDYPIKAVYIKTMPGDGRGDAIIQNITYQDIKINQPLWWGIYVGPKNDKPGCTFYPYQHEHCETHPLVTIKDITLKNIQQNGGLLPPGILRCNSTKQCNGFYFENVYSLGWYNLLEYGYITENVQGKTWLSFPSPSFNTTISSMEEVEQSFTEAIEFRDKHFSTEGIIQKDFSAIE